MPYAFPNRANAAAIASSTFWSLDHGATLLAALFNVNSSVVASMREGRDALDVFMRAGQPGRHLVSATERWPQSDSPLVDLLYITDYNAELARLLNELNSALSDRTSSSTREEANQTGRQQGPAQRERGEDEGRDRANAFKRIEELRISFHHYLRDSTKQWNRQMFETIAPAIWTFAATSQDSHS